MKNSLSKIVTLTVNPALDFYTAVDELTPGIKLRGKAPLVDAGGGGVNVSRGLAELGVASTAIFTVGGYTGSGYRERLRQYESHVEQTPVAVASNTRESFIVLEESSNKLFRFGMPGGKLNPNEIEALLNALDKASPFDMLVASGSIAPGMPDDFFVEVARRAHKLNAKFILDTSGPPLSTIRSADAYFLKPNLGELKDLTGKPVESRDEQVNALKHLVNTHDIENILLSLGADGALLVTRESVTEIPALEAEAKSSVGAGDSTVAGMVYQLSRGESVERAALFGIACGTAAILTPGTELFRAADAFHYYQELLSRNQGVDVDHSQRKS